MDFPRRPLCEIIAAPVNRVGFFSVGDIAGPPPTSCPGRRCAAIRTARCATRAGFHRRRTVCFGLIRFDETLSLSITTTALADRSIASPRLGVRLLVTSIGLGEWAGQHTVYSCLHGPDQNVLALEAWQIDVTVEIFPQILQ